MSVLLIALFIYIAVAVYYRYKPIPKGINGENFECYIPADQASFLYDLTNSTEKIMTAEQKIFSATQDAIKQARQIILFDIFLFNKNKYNYKKHIPTTDIIINSLKEKNIPRFFITDPLNTSYSTETAEPLAELERIGVKVIFTDLDKLPDNNTLYSPFWRIFLQWFGTRGKNHIPNPISPKNKTTLRAILKGLNAKANHRKLLVADRRVIVSSSNLHDSSSFYSDSGVIVESAALANHFLRAEKALAEMSGKKIEIYFLEEEAVNEEKEDLSTLKVRPLMGQRIKKQIISDIKKLKRNDKITIGMLFLADRAIINLLKRKAKKEGVEAVCVLDNNRVTFEKKKSGLPNLYLAAELAGAGVNVRIFNDDENEYHAKFIYIRQADKSILNTGSANLTRRSLSGTNLENNLWLYGNSSLPVFQETEKYISKVKSADYTHEFKNKPRFYILGYYWARFAEFWGLASW